MTGMGSHLATSSFMLLARLAMVISTPAIGLAEVTNPAPPVFDIPRLLSVIAVDGNSDDWGEAGLRTAPLLDPESENPAGGFSASARVAWDDAGLCILVETSGGFGVEAENPGALYEASGIEIFASPNHFNGAPPAESRVVLQPILASGRDPRHPQARCYIYDNRPPELIASAPPSCEFAAKHTEDRAIYEVRIPWSQLGLTPREGLVLGLQIQANDADETQRLTQLRWNTAPGKGQALRLAGTGASAITSTATASYELPERIRVIVRAAPNSVVRAESAIASAEAATDAAGQAILHLPMPGWGGAGSPIRVSDAAGNAFAWIELPVATKFRHAFLESMPLTISGDNVFAGEEFPPLDPLPGKVASSLIEPGSLRIRFFNRDGEECTRAEKTGRYFAIVTLTSKGGKEITRRIDLFRANEELDPHFAGPDDQLAAAAGIAPPKTEADRRLFASVRKNVFDDFKKRIFNRAAILSALHERDEGPVRVMTARLNAWYQLDKKQGTVEPVRHLALLPPDHAKHPDKKWPVLVFLHGTGWHHESSALKEPIRKFWESQADRDFILLQPLAPRGTSWVPDQLIDWLEETLPEVNGDSSRVILTGFSMGGIGTWNVACAHPDRFAAFVPLASVGEHAPPDAAAGRPLWCFHGQTDGMDYRPAKQWTERLREIDPAADVRFTLLENTDHTNTSERVYSRPDLREWIQKILHP